MRTKILAVFILACTMKLYNISSILCKKVNHLSKVFLLLLFMVAYTSCEKLVEVPPPPGQITEDFVFTTDASAISVLTDLYRVFNANPFQGANATGSISLFAGLSADEYKLNDGITDAKYFGYYYNALSQSGSPIAGAEHWAPLYNLVFKCNAAIEGLSASKTLTLVIKQQLLGEAKFMRAFFYFYLVNMYGDVPLALTTDPEVSRFLARSPKAEIYDQIRTDLIEAKNLLSDNFLDATLLNTTVQRVRPTKWAAAALLARVYLYTEEWESAEAESSLIISNIGLFGLPSNLNDVFVKNSREAIWQIQPTDEKFNTLDAKVFIIPSTGPAAGGSENPVQLSSFLKNSFELGDQRAVYGNWIDTTIYKKTATSWDTIAYPFKYKVYLPNININNSTGTANIQEYFMVLRLAEQYLIRAEARAQQQNISGAQFDLNAIRIRAGLGKATAADKTSLVTAIINERRHELFSEWAHRWFDLKRTGKIDELMTVVTPIKSAGTRNWQSYQQLYPLSKAELQKAPNLVQNPEY
jgi:starch-binding outer membrane protein, SusD/RagB family